MQRRSNKNYILGLFSFVAEGQIEVNYDTKRVGIFRKAVTVNSNAKTPTVILRIMGEVLEEEEDDGQMN